MFLLGERANTSCNTISDSAINYQVEESCSSLAEWSVPLYGCLYAVCVCKCVFIGAVLQQGEDTERKKKRT